MNKRTLNRTQLLHNRFGIFMLVSFAYLSLGLKSNTGNCTLSVKIIGLQNKQGVVEIGLYSTPAKFPIPGKTYKMVRPSISSKEVIYTFENLPKGDYAIATYHDENSDKKCNRNFFGIPTEAYAFSKNYRPFLSPPDFEDCSFHVDGTKSITILMVY